MGTCGIFIYPSSDTRKVFQLVDMEVELSSELIPLVCVGQDIDRFALGSRVVLEYAQRRHILNHKKT